MTLFIACLVLGGAYIYLFWSLKRGRISYSYKAGITHKSVVIDREDSPVFFWLTWAGSMVTLTTMVITFITNYA